MDFDFDGSLWRPLGAACRWHLGDRGSVTFALRIASVTELRSYLIIPFFGDFMGCDFDLALALSTVEAPVGKTSSCGSHGYGLNGIGMCKGAQYKV